MGTITQLLLISIQFLPLVLAVLIFWGTLGLGRRKKSENSATTRRDT